MAHTISSGWLPPGFSPVTMQRIFIFPVKTDTALIKPSKLQFLWIKNIPRNIFWDPTSYRHPFIFLLICCIFSLCANVVIKEWTISWWFITEFYCFYNYTMQILCQVAEKVFNKLILLYTFLFTCFESTHQLNKTVLIGKDISLFLTTAMIMKRENKHATDFEKVNN